MNSDDPAARFQSKVADVFMLDNFFSPIMRDKIPQMLFSNGSSGLDRMFPLTRPSSAQPFRSFPLFEERSESPNSVVRRVPIKVNPNSNNNGPIRIDNSRAASETEDSDSSGTLRRVDSPSYGSRRPSNLYSDRSSLAPSMSRRSTPSPQPPQQNQLSRSATPTEASNFTSNSHRLPPYYPQRYKPFVSTNSNNASNNSSFDSLPRNDRIYERQTYHNPKTRPFQSTSTLKLSNPDKENPSVPFLRRTHTSQDVLNESDRLENRPEQFSSPLERRDSEPAIAIEKEESALPPRPNSRLSAKSRAKSPSLTSLKQGLKKANLIAQCLTKQNKAEQKTNDLKVEVDEPAYKPPPSSNQEKSKKEQQASPNKKDKREPQASPAKSNKSSFLSFWQRPSRTQSTPSLVEPKPLSLRRPSENDLTLDPVEEAIKSLENFDPNEYIKPAVNSGQSKETEKNVGGRSESSFDVTHSKSVDKPGPTLQRNSYGSINLPQIASLPPIPKVDYNNTESKMGNTGTFNRQKPPSVPQRGPQTVSFQIPSHNNRLEADARKRALMQQMTDNAKLIELNAIKIGRIVSNSNWRQPKQLEKTLPIIRDIAYNVENSLHDLIEGTARVSVQRSDPAYQELQNLINPLRTTLSIIRRLRTTLNWSIPSLSRQTSSGMEDSLDQLVGILKHLDCSKLVHLIYNQDRLNTMSFLPAGVSTAPPPNMNQKSPIHQQSPISPIYQSRQTPNQLRQQNLSPITPTAGLRREKPYLPTKNPTLSPQWQAEMIDGGESTTSSNDSSPIRSTDDESTAKHSSSATPNQRNRDEDSIIDEEMIMEEDDLASVISEQPSPTWHGTAPEFPTRIRQNSGDTKRHQLHMDALKNMNEEELEFLKFCAPQINQGVDTLTHLIEEFFNTIETGQHPNKFSQKLKLISMESMTLVHFASNVARHVGQPVLRAEFKHAADSIDSLAIECEHKLESAKKQHPSVSAIQQLVSAVVSLSKQAQNLKLITRTCQLAANDSFYQR